MQKPSTCFRHNICYARRHFALTQKEMAQILGISVSKLRRIESGDPSVRLHDKMLCAFCNYFKLSADSVILRRMEDQNFSLSQEPIIREGQ